MLLCWILNRVMQKTTKIFLNGLQRPINCESWVELLDKKERLNLGLLANTWLIRMITCVIILMGLVHLKIRPKPYPRRKVQRIFIRECCWMRISNKVPNNFIRHAKLKLFHKGDSFFALLLFAGTSNWKPSNTFLWLNYILQSSTWLHGGWF